MTNLRATIPPRDRYERSLSRALSSGLWWGARVINAPGSKEKRYRQRIEYGDESKREQTNRTLEIRDRRADQLAEISHGPDIDVGLLALRIDFGLLDSHA